jgi:ferrochelatase
MIDNFSKRVKVAVVLFNLGGPCSLQTVKPFLFNLFKDRFIIDLPAFLRYPLAFLISTLREKKAKKIYQHIGGKSPLLQYTLCQKNALQEELLKCSTSQVYFSTHICMRYWHPMAPEVVENLENEKPDHIIFLPLYPQYSTTTTASSFKDLSDHLAKSKTLKNVAIHRITSYETDPSFIRSHVELIRKVLENLTPEDHLNAVILFSAHGIPLDRIEKGDPYQKHIEKSVTYIMKFFSDTNYEICYQSKVGPKKWLEPCTEKTITKYSTAKKHIIVVPIAFVSDHSETLVELDIDYADVAKRLGALSYNRVQALNTDKNFITCLKDLVLAEIRSILNNQV